MTVDTEFDQLSDMAERTSAGYLDDILGAWHRWSATDRDGIGYPAECPTFRMRTGSRQWDDRTGAMDAYAEATQSEAVDAIISSMDRIHRAALSMCARNIATGHQVWASPLLPADRVQRAHVVSEARDALADRLRSRGLWWA